MGTLKSFETSYLAGRAMSVAYEGATDQEPNR